MKVRPYVISPSFCLEQGKEHGLRLSVHIGAPPLSQLVSSKGSHEHGDREISTFVSNWAGNLKDLRSFSSLS